MAEAISVMQNFKADNHPSIKHGKVGVLLINLGTPEAPTAKAVRKYLKEFLSDRRVVEVPAIIWQVILRLIILPFRSKKSAAAYAKIWGEEGSPLRVNTKAQADGLGQVFGGEGGEGNIIVEWAMRYGSPSIADKIDLLRERGCDRILFCPLYPQYASATVGSVRDAIFAKLSSMRWQGEVRFLSSYYDDDLYIDVLRRSILAKVNFENEGEAGFCDGLLVSFHGLPKRSLELGDPYYCHCHKTARLLGEALNLGEDRGGRIFMAFQSRFGAAEWLSPYADEVVRELAGGGGRRLAVICVGFSSDCLETLEEVNMGLREEFLGHGGEMFEYIECLNGSKLGLELLENLIRKELSNWI